LSVDGSRPPTSARRLQPSATVGTTIRIARLHHPSCMSRKASDLRFLWAVGDRWRPPMPLIDRCGTDPARTEVRVTPLWWLTSADRFRCRLVGPATPHMPVPRPATQPVKPFDYSAAVQIEAAAWPGRRSGCGQARRCSYLISSRSLRRSIAPRPGCPSRRLRRGGCRPKYKTVRTPWNCCCRHDMRTPPAGHR
jgi:hypothetical protein